MFNVINGKSQQILAGFPDDHIDICITSPPYKDLDGYSPQLIQDIFWQVYRVLKPNSLLFLNFGHLANEKSRPFQVVLILESLGFKLAETFTWIKTQYRPIQGRKRVNNLTEFVFMFYKDKMPALDRLSIGLPYKDKSNIGRYNSIDLKCQGNAWTIPYETIQHKSQKLHNDRFPVGLPLNCLKLADLQPGSLVLDPFGGSCTTGVAAKQLGHNFIGIDLNLNHCKLGRLRLSLV